MFDSSTLRLTPNEAGIATFKALLPGEYLLSTPDAYLQIMHVDVPCAPVHKPADQALQRFGESLSQPEVDRLEYLVDRSGARVVVALLSADSNRKREMGGSLTPAHH